MIKEKYLLSNISNKKWYTSNDLTNINEKTSNVDVSHILGISKGKIFLDSTETEFNKKFYVCENCDLNKYKEFNAFGEKRYLLNDNLFSSTSNNYINSLNELSILNLPNNGEFTGVIEFEDNYYFVVYNKTDESYNYKVYKTSKNNDLTESNSYEDFGTIETTSYFRYVQSYKNYIFISSNYETQEFVIFNILTKESQVIKCDDIYSGNKRGNFLIINNYLFIYDYNYVRYIIRENDETIELYDRQRLGVAKTYSTYQYRQKAFYDEFNDILFICDSNTNSLSTTNFSFVIRNVSKGGLIYDFSSSDYPNIFGTHRVLKPTFTNLNNFTYTINGKQKESNPDEYMYDTNDIPKIQLHVENGYAILSVKTDYGSYDTRTMSITYDDSTAYIDDKITVIAYKLEPIEKGSYFIHSNLVENDFEINVTGTAIINDEYFDFNKLVGKSTLMYFVNGEIEKKVNDCKCVKFDDSFDSLDQGINGTFMTKCNLSLRNTFNIELGKGATSQFVNDDNNSIIKMNDDTYIVINRGDIGFGVISNNYKIANIEYNIGFLEGTHLILEELGDNSILNVKVETISENVVTLYYNKSKNYVVNKELQLIGTHKGKIKNTKSILNPEIVIELDDFTNFNYVYIDLFKRYYYVQDIVSNGYNLYTLYLKVDTLKTYASSIIGLQAYCSRTEKEYNSKLYDSMNPLSNTIIDENIIEPIKTTANFRKNASYNVAITIAGTLDINSSDTIVETNPVVKNPLINHDYPEFNPNYRTVIFYDEKEAKKFIDWLQANNLDSYLLNVVIYPMNIITLNDYKGSSWTYSKISKIIVNDKEYTITSETDYNKMYQAEICTFTPFQFTINTPSNVPDFMKENTNVELYIPLHGWISLSSLLVLDKILTLSYIMDYTTGNSDILLTASDNYSGDNPRLVFSSAVSLSMLMGYSIDNNADNELRRSALNQTTAISTITNAISSGLSLASGNALGFIGSVIGEGKTIANNILQQKMIYDKASNSFSSGVNAYHVDLNARYRITYQKTLLDDYEEYSKNYGQPTNKIVELKQGFYQLLTANEFVFKHTSNTTVNLKSEEEEIKTLLTRGIYII